MNSGIRILIAEDDVHDARLTLRALGILPEDEVLVVTDGKEVLDYLYRRRRFDGWPSLQPAVVLLDLKMPHMDGFEVLTQVKGDAALKMIPVIVLTSSRQPTDLMRAYGLGANAYVVKAMNFDDYVEALGALNRFWLQINETPPPCMERTTRQTPVDLPEKPKA